MDDRDVAQIAVSTVAGGAIWQCVRYFLGYFKLRSDKDGRIVDQTLAYADALRGEMDSMRKEFREETTELKAHIASLRQELAAAHDTIRELYASQVKHLKECRNLGS